MFSHEALPKTLVGRDSGRMTKSSASEFADPERFLARIDEILAAGEAVSNEPIQRADGSWVERDYIPIKAHDEIDGHLWHYRDVPVSRAMAA
jgi:hypothetical protein